MLSPSVKVAYSKVHFVTPKAACPEQISLATMWQVDNEELLARPLAQCSPLSHHQSHGSQHIFHHSRLHHRLSREIQSTDELLFLLSVTNEHPQYIYFSFDFSRRPLEVQGSDVNSVFESCDGVVLDLRSCDRSRSKSSEYSITTSPMMSCWWKFHGSTKHHTTTRICRQTWPPWIPQSVELEN